MSQIFWREGEDRILFWYPKTGIIYQPDSFWFLKLKILSEFLYFFIIIHYKHCAVCNPILRVTDSKWCSALQGIEYSWPQGSWCFPLVCIWPGPRQHKWRQMKLQRPRDHRLPLARAGNAGPWLVSGEPTLPDLTLHDSSDVIINYWRWALLCTPPWHSPPDPVIGPLWGSWDTGNWPNADTATGQLTNQGTVFFIHNQSQASRIANHTGNISIVICF